MGYYRDLREFLDVLEQKGKLTRIERPINKDRTLMPFFRLQFRGLPEEERKVFLFTQVTDAKGRTYHGRVAAGVYGASRDIYALGMMCGPEETTERWRQALDYPIEPKIVSAGPVQEEVHLGAALEEMGLDELPAPVEEPGFSGTIRTGTQYVTKDPESGIRNLGEYSGHFRARGRLAMGIAPTHHAHIHWEKCREMGRHLQAAIIVGATPNIAQVASAPLPYGLDEYKIAGGIAGEPVELVRCKTVDLEVPARAEIVIEGEILTDVLEPHTSFGEYPGYMYQGKGDSRPVMRVTCITHRHNPIFTPLLVGLPPSDCHKLMQVSTEAFYYKFLKYDSHNDCIRDVAFHESGGSWNYCVVQIRKRHPTDPWQILNAIAGYEPAVGKISIVVDEDIDPRDPDSVNWALSFSMQPHRDVRIITGRTPMLDPSGYPPGASSEERSFPQPFGSSAILIDATRKWAYPPVGLPRKEFMEEALKLWEEEGLPKLKLKKPWFGYSLGNWTDEDRENAELILQGEYKKIGEKLLDRQVKIR